MSIDPVTFMDTGEPAMFNRYSYAFNDPINLTDPTGECPICIPIAIFIVKEIAGEVFTAQTGLPAPTVKGLGKAGLKQVGKAGTAKARSNAKRQMSRQVQRNKNIPTSQSGKQIQNKNKPNQPRHQIKKDSNGKDNGIVDGANDTVHDTPHIEAGPLKQGDKLNKHGQPRIQEGQKAKIEQKRLDE